MGCQSPLRDIGVRRPLTAGSTQLLATFRPRRSSRPRRFAPPHTLRACSIPQPRTGFSLQGFNATAEPCRVLPDRCPPAVSTNPPATRRSHQKDGARLQGFAPCDARADLRWTVRPIRTPRPSWDFSSSRGFVRHRRDVFTPLPPRTFTSRHPSLLVSGVLPVSSPGRSG
jgi:hypothetical protein